MNKSTLRNLSIVLFALVAILVGIELSDKTDTVSSGGLLFPDLKAQINNINAVTVEASGEQAQRISAADGAWTVQNNGGYPADVGKIREVLLAFADARVLEEKTANPERYAALGVRGPDEAGSQGVRVSLSGDGVDYALIVGNVNQGSNRYVRIDGQPQSVLIDKNPGLPEAASGWLQKALIDLDGASIRAVAVQHADGETIRIQKASRDDNDFSVDDVPEGRELSYSTVANGIGSALSDLQLDDVRAAEDGEATTTTVYDTFDGRRIAVATFADEEETWVALTAAYSAAETEESAGDEQHADQATAEVAETAEPFDAAAAVDELNARVAGWQFKIPDFKKNQLTRRWDDILKSENDASE